MSTLIYYFLLILGVLSAVGLYLLLFASGGHTDDDPDLEGMG